MNELTPNDLNYVVMRLPRDIRQLLTEHAGKLFMGGGFIRATIAGEQPSDIDLFGTSPELLNSIATILQTRREGSKIHRSKNALTLLTQDRMPVQFITRWTFDAAEALVSSFDFTVCQAAVWRAGPTARSPWKSCTGAAFYSDLAARRLVYTAPVRDEEAGGSMLRAIKYIKRGYTIQVSSLGGVIARLAAKLRDSHMAQTEEGTARVLTGLLREVDPTLVVDGLEVVDEHETDDADEVEVTA